jgi:hypothetical protein
MQSSNLNRRPHELSAEVQAAAAVKRALEFDRLAGLAMRDGDVPAYEHNRDQARAAWSRYWASIEMQKAHAA